MSSQPQNQSPALHACSGAVASAISLLMLYPLENIKTLMQVQSLKNNTPANTQDAKNSDTQRVQELKLLKLIQKTYQEKGVPQFYIGLKSFLIGTTASQFVYFLVYQFIKKKFNLDPNVLSGYVIYAFVSGMASSAVTTPFWLINTRTISLQKSFGEVFTELVSREGFGALYKGFLSNIILVLNPIISFVVYEFLKLRIKKFQTKQNEFFLFFVAGAISKALATYATFPIQFLRTFAQTNQSNNQFSYVNTALRILKQDGLPGLFKGLTPKLIQTVLNNAFLMAYYEKIVKIMSYVFKAMNAEKAIAAK